MESSQGVMEPKATKSCWNADDERQKIANGAYDGYITNYVKSILPKLPHPRPEFSDAFQEFVGYALEAVELFREDRGCTFSTFVYRHLGLRSYQWFNVSWMARNQPKGCFVNTFSQRSEMLDVYNSEKEWDPTRVRDTQQVDTMMGEFKRALTDRARQLFEYFVDLLEWGENSGSSSVLEAFSHVYNARKVADLTGLSYKETRAVLEEIQSKALKYLTL